MRVSKSRNVCGYVKANLKHQKLAAKLKAKEERLRPLKNDTEAALVDAIQRWGKLTGGQQAEAKRIINNALAEVLV